MTEVQIGLTILGPAPDRGSRRPFTGPAEERLARLLRAPSVQDMRYDLDLDTLFYKWPGEAEGGDAFPLYLAIPKAGAYIPKMSILILAGKKVARAFNWILPGLTWGILKGVACASIPHPSGRNHTWNDPAAEREVAHFLSQAVLALELWK